MTAIEAANDIAQGHRSGERGREGPSQKKADPVADMVIERWKRSSEELLRQRRDYWQNLSFFYGEQWVWWDKRRNTLSSFPVEFSPLGKGRARVVANKITPNTISVLSRLLGNTLEFDVPPSDSADDVVAASMLASDVLNARHHDAAWEDVRYGENFAKVIGGTSAVCVEWDASAGTALAIDEQTHAVVGTGEETLTSLAITEFGVEPGVRDWRKANWWVMGLALSPEHVRDHYGLDWTPSPDVSQLLSPLQQRLLEHMGKGQGGNRLTLVVTLYEKPNKKTPKGRVVTVCNDVVIAKSDWPFPDKERLNLFVWRQQAVQGSWMGRTFVNDAVPIQTQYNFVSSVLTEHTKKVGNTRTIAPVGSFSEDELTDDPSSILWYMPDVGGGKPEYMKPAEVSRWLIAELPRLGAELDDMMFVHATSRGEASFDRASGQALALLAEKDDSPLGLMAREEAQVWGELATYVLKLYEAKVLETRQVQIAPQPGQAGQVRQSRWNGAALKGQTRAFVPLENTMPISQAAQQAFAKDLWDRQIVKDPMMFARMARLPQRELVDIIDADVAKATRENARMMEGMALQPAEFDDHGKHIAEHNRFRKSDSYAYANEEVRQIVDLHVLFHEKVAAEQMGSQVGRAQLSPALAAVPQANEPPGSQVPQDFAEQQAQLSMLEGAAAGNMPNGAGTEPPPDDTAMQGGSVGLQGGAV